MDEQSRRIECASIMEDCEDVEVDCAPYGHGGEELAHRLHDAHNIHHPKHAHFKNERFDSGVDSGVNLSGLKSDLDEGRLTSDYESWVSLSGSSSSRSIEEGVQRLCLKVSNSGTKCESIDEGFSSGLKSSESLLSDDIKDTVSVPKESDNVKSETEVEEANRCREVFEQDEDGDTQLHTAIIQLLADLALYFICLVRDSSLLNIRNNYLQTPLHLAVITKQVVLVRKLMSSGAQVDVRDHKGNSPLHIACKEGHTVIAAVLVEPITYDETRENKYELQFQRIPQNMEGRNYNGQVCLHVAAEGGHRDILNILLNKGADINARDGKSGRTILHYAAEFGNLEMLEFLLQWPQLNINAVTYGGLTPVMLAKGRGHERVVSILRGRGAFYESDDSEEEDMNEEGYDDFMINGRPIVNHS